MPDLTVHLIKIVNLRSASCLDKAVPFYVKFELEQNGMVFFRDRGFGQTESTRKSKECNPIYKETFVFDGLPGLNNMDLTIKVIDDDAALRDNTLTLARCRINLEDLDLEPTPMRIRRKIDNNMFGKDAYVFLNLSYGESVAGTDTDAERLSPIGQAAYEALRTKHREYHHSLWNVTHGKVVGKLHQTPLQAFPGPPDGYEDGHDDWFPQIMGKILSRTRVWADVLSIGPPDGKFLAAFKDALTKIAENAGERDDPVVIRMMFACDCDAVRDALTSDLPEDANLRLWIGAWRRGMSWNHAKIIAVDGKYLHTGGHNLWDPHYLEHDPVHDLSLEMEGAIAYDGHKFANQQWNYIETRKETIWGTIGAKTPHILPQIAARPVIVSEWPVGNASRYPPRFKTRLVREMAEVDGPLEDPVPVIAVGRYGDPTLRERPADDALLAMLGAAESTIKLALQDLGPVCIPNTKIPLPGMSWPDNYLTVLAKVLWEKGVDVEIVVSNPWSIPGGLTPICANYGHGWSCVDVAVEIIKRIQRDYPDADDDSLREKVRDNLRVAFLRQERGTHWADGQSIGMHSKHFIVDDTAAYIGSQNLYVCDLAEWGVIIDDKGQIQQFLEEYWIPMWEWSYTREDVDVDAVMDALDWEKSDCATCRDIPFFRVANRKNRNVLVKP